MSAQARAPRRRFGGRPSRRLAWRLVLLVIGGVLAYFGVSLLVNNFDEVLGAFDVVSHPELGWLAVAVVAELLSFVTYAIAQRVLLSAQGRPIGIGPLSLLALAAQALGVCLPGGFAWQNLLSYKVLRRFHVDEVTSGRVLVLTSALYVAALALLALIGAQLAGDNGPVADVRLVAYGVLGVIVVLTGVWLLRPREVRRVALRLVAWVERRLERHGWSGRERAEALAQELAEASRLGRTRVALSALFALLAWIGDIGCLVAAFGAVGGSVPVQGLLLAYCGAQLAALLPFTPGGLGVVEGSLALALVSYGGGQEKTVAAVLLYRLISFWGLIPVGALCYGILRLPRVGRAAERAST